MTWGCRKSFSAQGRGLEPAGADWVHMGAPACAQGSICSELVRRLAEHGPSLARAVGLAAEVDCLAALACVARERNYARPVLTQDNVLHIKQGGPLRRDKAPHHILCGTHAQAPAALQTQVASWHVLESTLHF